MSLTTFDHVRIGAFLTLAIVLAIKKPEHFILADALVVLITAGLSIFTPSYAASHMSIPNNALSDLMQQAFGCMVLLPVIFYFFFGRHSSCDDAMDSILGCRTFATALVMVVVGAFRCQHPTLFNEKQFMIIMTGNLIWFILAFYHFYRNGKVTPKKGRFSPIDIFLKVDIVFFALAAAGDIFLSSYFSRVLTISMTNLHVFQAALVGSANAATVVLGYYALGYRSTSERKGFLCCRISVLVILSVCIGYSVITKHLIVSKLDLLFLCAFTPVAISAYIGLMITSDRRSVSSSRCYNLRQRNC